MLKLKRWFDRGSIGVRALGEKLALFLVASIMTLSFIAGNMQPVGAQSFSSAASLGSSSGVGLSTCAIETVGWVICPTMRTIAKLADYGFAFINQNYLKIEYALTGDNGGVSIAWDMMRTVANVAFVLAFLYIIYAQITGRNAGGYNIKRILPRLIIGAVLVNISFVICGLALDVSNALGSAIFQIMKVVTDKIGTPAMSLDNAANGFQDGVLSSIVSSILTKSGTVWILMAPAAAITIAIALVSAAGIVLLIARKVIVSMLILASPLVFVTWLLPNLEHYFQQWLRLFFQLLLLYPIIAFLLGTGQIISATIINVGSGNSDANYAVKDDSYQAKSGGSGSAMTDLTACAAAVLPLIGVWFMMKSLSSVMTTAGSRISASVTRSGRSKEQAEKMQAKFGKPGGIPPTTANNINVMGGRVNVFDRKPQFSRISGRRHVASRGGSANPAAAGSANKPPQPNGLGQALSGMMPGGGDKNPQQQAAEAAQQKQAELQNAQINADNTQAAGVQIAATLQAEAKGDDKKQGKTAKDIFNNMNRSHQSKDQGRSFGAAGGQPSGGGGSSGGGGGNGPTAPAPEYRAPTIAQAPSVPAPSGGGGPQRVVAVPVQIDASQLLNQPSPEMTQHQPPVTEMQQKAKAHAQKYLFESAKGVESAADRLEVLNKKLENEAEDKKGE